MGLTPNHPDTAAFEQFALRRCGAAQTKLNEDFAKSARVRRGHVNEYVEILSQPRFTVTRYRVTSDEQKPYVMRE